MRYSERLDKKEVVNMIMMKSAALRGSAALDDQRKADALDEMAAEVEKMPPGGWMPPASEPFPEILLLIRAETKSKDGKGTDKHVGVGTYKAGKNGSPGLWRYISGKPMPAQLVTGWMYMPKP